MEEFWHKGKSALYIKESRSIYADVFTELLLTSCLLSVSCKKFKLADLTIADFWGIENVAPEINDDLGTSLVITRTEKGQAIFEVAKSQLYWKEVSYEKGIRFNPAEYCSPIRPEQRNIFFDDLAHIPFSEMEKKYASENIVPRTLRIKRKLRKIIAKIVLYGSFIKSKRNSEQLNGKNVRG